MYKKVLEQQGCSLILRRKIFLLWVVYEQNANLWINPHNKGFQTNYFLKVH